LFFPTRIPFENTTLGNIGVVNPFGGVSVVLEEAFCFFFLARCDETPILAAECLYHASAEELVPVVCGKIGAEPFGVLEKIGKCACPKKPRELRIHPEEKRTSSLSLSPGGGMRDLHAPHESANSVDELE
jgi:hypothetical protein